MILISNILQSRQISFSKTSNDAYNVSAVVVGRKKSNLLILSVYRAPSACVVDTKDVCKLLDSILVQHKKIIITDDFNVPKLYSTDHTFTSGCDNIITQLALEHNLTQLARVPTRGDSLLDLIFISGNIKAVYLTNIPPVGDTGHDGQLLHLVSNPDVLSNSSHYSTIDYESVGALLSCVKWNEEFLYCSCVDDYANKFTSILKNAVVTYTHFRPRLNRLRLPKHTVNLLRIKQRM